MGQGFGSVWNDWGDRRGGVGCGCEAVTDFGGERFGCMGGMGSDAGAAWRMSAFHVRRGDMAPVAQVRRGTSPFRELFGRGFECLGFELVGFGWVGGVLDWWCW